MTDHFIEVESKETGNRFLIDPANYDSKVLSKVTDDKSADNKKKETI